MNRIRTALRDNGLTLFFLALLFGALIGESFVGQAHFNAEQIADGGRSFTWLQYVTSSSFAVDVAENWQSEYLQFALYILATVWLVQRGSSESKEPEHIGRMSDESQLLGEHAQPDSPRFARGGGGLAKLYGHSLGLIMILFFFGSWLAQSIAGHAAYNHDQLAQFEDPVSWGTYISTAEFWDRTFQNWQSEFLAVASMAIFTVFLRERGSPESKPVGEPHYEMGENE
jgi:membrane protein implicated in regulation of membrane protease activity